MAYDYTKKGRRYRRGDDTKRIWLLLLLAVCTTGACLYFVIKY